MSLAQWILLILAAVPWTLIIAVLAVSMRRKKQAKSVRESLRIIKGGRSD